MALELLAGALQGLSAGSNRQIEALSEAVAPGRSIGLPLGDRLGVAGALKGRPVHIGLKRRKIHAQRRTALNAARQREVLTCLPLSQFMPAHQGGERCDALQARELIGKSGGHCEHLSSCLIVASCISAGTMSENRNV
jgi:hypothetical protein